MTPEDEAQIASVAARLARFGLVVERNTGRGFDGYRIRPRRSQLPRWIVLRVRSGQYRLLDGLMGVLAKGPTLESVVFPGWRQSSARESGTESGGRPERPDGRGRRRHRRA